METNKVMELCVQGMAAEAQDVDEARRIFRVAWEARQDDFDACIAAHYLARHQLTAETRVEWNERALGHADAVRDDRVASFYPSLYLNLATAYEELVVADQNYENVRRARKYFALAAECGKQLPPGPYADMVISGSAGGLRRADAILGAQAGQ